MTGPEIYAELVRRSITQTEIAKKLKCSPQSVNNVIYGHRTSKRIREYIAKKIGHKKVDAVWPASPQPPKERGKRK